MSYAALLKTSLLGRRRECDATQALQGWSPLAIPCGSSEGFAFGKEASVRCYAGAPRAEPFIHTIWLVRRLQFQKGGGCAML